MPRPQSRAGARAKRTPLSRDRRRFLKLAALAGATSALGGFQIAMAQTATKPDTTKKVEPAPATPPPAEVPPEIAADAKALMGILERRYGKHLDAEQLAAIERELQGRLRAGRALRDAKLGNHDEPDTVFKA